MLRWPYMQLSEVFLAIGEERLGDLIKGISIGKLRTYQLYERFKIRTHLAKLNTENLRKATPRFWQRLTEKDNEFASDLSQAILIPHMEMIVSVLNFLGVPNQQGFFDKDLDAKKHLIDGWQARAWEQFQGQYPPSLLLFYLNHLTSELNLGEAFLPQA